MWLLQPALLALSELGGDRLTIADGSALLRLNGSTEQQATGVFSLWLMVDDVALPLGAAGALLLCNL